jgi:hypothetical protein
MSGGGLKTRFDWPLCLEAEEVLERWIAGFCDRNGACASFANRLNREAGCLLFDFLDHLVVGVEHEPELRRLGFVEERVPVAAGTRVWRHPGALFPRVLTRRGVPSGAGAVELAVRPESLADFAHANRLDGEIQGVPGSAYRTLEVSPTKGARWFAVERLGGRGFLVKPAKAGRLEAVEAVRELWRMRPRHPESPARGVRAAFGTLKRVLKRVEPPVACQLFFEEERRYWQARNSAARLQHARQEALGLGWANHDHHTFRCSRERFADLQRFLGLLGFEKRERYYAGAEAGWGAQISEHPEVGIVVFADVDLMPEETTMDFSRRRLPPAPAHRTVGLWCALHGDSFLDAGMHHLEARFDFAALREQLAARGVGTMRPFSDFSFLKQAFTEGERWRVRPDRVDSLLRNGFITEDQAQSFLREGAIGSHLENLQRRGGFKGFNQKSVSVIISATDPRALQAGNTH